MMKINIFPIVASTLLTALCLISLFGKAQAQAPAGNNPYYYSDINPYYKYDHDNHLTNYLVGQCTWYVWGRCAEANWRLNASPGAATEFSAITNGSGRGLVATPGAIECSYSFDKKGNRVDHVAYVLQVANQLSWTITQYNVTPNQYSTGTVTRSSSASTSLSGAGFSKFTLVGFLYPPNTLPPPVTGLVSLYRYSNYLGRGDRFYTTNFNELGNGGFSGWVYEGVQCHVYASQVSGTVPLYRYVSPSLGLHFFTIQNADLTHLGYYQEGIACYVYGNSICYTDPNIVPLYRYFNTRSGAHFYTTNRAELGGGGGDWKDEGIECNVRR